MTLVLTAVTDAIGAWLAALMGDKGHGVSSPLPAPSLHPATSVTPHDGANENPLKSCVSIFDVSSAFKSM